MNLLFHYGLAGLRVKELMSSRVGELTSSEIEKLGLRLKKTEVGEIPEDWEVVRLGEVVIKIKAGGTPNTSEGKYWGGKIAFTLIEDLVNAGKFLVKTNASITKLGLKNSSSWVVPENSIILSLYATVGKPVINKIPVAITQNMIGIIPNKEIIDLEFLYYALENVREKLWKYIDLSVHKHITTSEARKILIPLPPLPEQQEIAEILQTIDQKIEIEKKKKELYEELFKTMLNKIMSQQIDINLLDY
jgi:type I restriction enzyme S subunit